MKTTDGFDRDFPAQADFPVANRRPIVLKVHLELDIGGCDADDLCVLRQYGKMDKAISRDILVPADMPLSALHYAIQQLFGWQNGHLHRFAFPENVFERLTKGKFSQWCRFAGVYFRFPSEEPGENDWDGYGFTSLKTAFRNAYRGPYRYFGIGDCYLENQRQIRILEQELPVVPVMPSFAEFMKSGGNPNLAKRNVNLKDVTVDEMRRSVDLGGGLDNLLERLTLLEYLRLPNGDSPCGDLDDEVRFLEEKSEQLLKMWDEVREHIFDDYEKYCRLNTFTTVRLHPQSDELKYFYDYGDGWEVNISLTDAYYEENLAPDEVSDIATVWERHAPICLAADGLSVVEDVGGVGGYVTFLQTLHDSKDPDEKANAREWAGSLGWSGRIKQPKNML